jgi:hypothetical protein
MFNGVRTMPGINEILSRGSGRENLLLTLSLASFKSGSCCWSAPLWLPNSSVSLMSFIHSDLLSGKRGHVEPSERTVFIFGQLVWALNISLRVETGLNSDP